MNDRGELSEHEVQAQVVRWYREMSVYDHRYGYIFAVPNGGKRHRGAAVKLKREGVMAGVSDLVIPIASGGYHGAFIEVKTTSGRVQKTQVDFLSVMSERGYYTAVTRGVAETIDTIDRYICGLT